jgi:hypothetical protein
VPERGEEKLAVFAFVKLALRWFVSFIRYSALRYFHHVFAQNFSHLIWRNGFYGLVIATLCGCDDHRLSLDVHRTLHLQSSTNVCLY